MTQREKQNLKLAPLISTVLSPPIVAGVTFLVLLAFERAPNFAVVVLTLSFGTIAPLAVVFLTRNGVVSDASASRQSRTAPFTMAIASYFVGSILLSEAGAPRPVIALMVCYFGNSVIMMLMSTRWRISVHASGVTGPGTVLTYALGPSSLPFFLLSIPVGWARARQGAHTPLQVVTGALLTVLTTWLQLKLLL